MGHLVLGGIVLCIAAYFLWNHCEQQPRTTAIHQTQFTTTGGYDQYQTSPSPPPSYRRMLGRKLPTARKDPFRDLKVAIETLENPLPLEEMMPAFLCSRCPMISVVCLVSTIICGGYSLFRVSLNWHGFLSRTK